MTPSILEERIASLRRNLMRANAASEQQLEFAHITVGEEPWIRAFNEIRRNSAKDLKMLEALVAEVADGNIDPGQAWQSYSDIECLSEEVFRECLEVLGGLVFRDMRLDEKICLFADELIKECAKSVGKMPTIVIPSPDRVPPVDMRRIAHIRFPEWDVWTLPLVAHEYGRVAIVETEQANEFATETAHEAYLGLAGGRAVTPEAVEQRVRLLLADAFATFTNGPAYACALMLLRLDMVAPSPASRELVRQRADMVRGVIDALDTRGMIKAQIHQELASCWDQAIESLPPDDAEEADPLGALALEPADVFSALEQAFYPGAAYTPAHWSNAMRWGSDWLEQLDKGQNPARPADVLKTHRLRDALNASWYVRIQRPEWATEGAAVTQELCQEIIDGRGRGGQGHVRGESRPPGGG
ncbi:hypothetical protein OG357_02105 [Streptomyces sp. NBC_01255]|uniref:hypothetical protein n=1 Tax=Streptomyces sp. NBC_01255 TaxID=2903798 RepID=UPI002E31362A|nr:hypothetical protein [Streptomyces sp. NBC_01255]